MRSCTSSSQERKTRFRLGLTARRVIATMASSLLVMSSFPVPSALARQVEGDDSQVAATTVVFGDGSTAVSAPETTAGGVNVPAANDTSLTLPQRILASGTLPDGSTSPDSDESIYVDANMVSVPASEMDPSEAQLVANEYGIMLSDVEETVPSSEELTAPSSPVTSALSALGDGIMSLFSSEPSSPFSNVTLKWLTPDSTPSPDFDDARLSVFYDSDTRASAMMRFEAVLSGNEVYKVGQVQIAIPKAFLSGRDGKPVGQASFSVPQAPSNRTTFAYVETDNSYVLQNCVPLAPGSSIAIGFSIANIIPHMIESGSVSEPITATISLAGTDIEPVTAGPLTASFETATRVVDGSVQVRHERTTSAWNGVPDELRNLVDESAYSCMEFYSWGYVSGSQPYDLSLNAVASITGGSEGKNALVLGIKDNGNTVSSNVGSGSTFSASIGNSLASLNTEAPTYVRTYVAVPRDAAPAGEPCEVSLDLEYVASGVDSHVSSSSSAKSTKEYMNPATRGTAGTFGVSAENAPEEPLALNHLSKGMPVTTSLGATSIELRGSGSHTVRNALLTDYGFADPVLTSSVNANPNSPDVTVDSVRVGQIRTYMWKEYETPGIGYSALASDGEKTIGSGEFGYAADDSPKDVTITFYDAPDIASTNAFNALGTLSYDMQGNASVVALRDDVSWDGMSVLRIGGEHASHIVTKAEYGGDGVKLTCYPDYSFLPTDAMKDIASRAFSNSDSPYVLLRSALRVAIGDAAAGNLVYTDDAMCSGMLGGSSTYVSSDMFLSSSNDVINRNVKIRYTTTVHEQTNITDYKNLLSARENGMTFDDVRGTWRILLHPGMTVDMSSISVGTSSDVKNVRLVKNFRGSGRDLLIIDVANSPEFTVASRCGRYAYGDARTLVFSASYPWQAHELYGDEVRCVSSYESASENFGSVGGFKGESDTPSSMGNNSSYGVFEEVGTLLDGISDTPEHPGKFVYALSRCALGINTQSTSGYSKQALYAGGPPTNNLIVPESGAYAYRLSYSNGSGGSGTIGNLVLYDNIEAVGDWRGSFTSIDVSAIEAAGAKPVVYYSTKDVDIFSDAGRDLNDASVWTTMMPQANQVRAIAIDVTKSPDGSAFEFDEGTELWATVNMTAPSAAQVSPEDPSLAYTTCENAPSAKNESLATYTLNGQKRELSGGIVTVKLARYDLNGTISFADERDNDGKRPDAITLRLMRNGRYEGHSLRWTADGEMDSLDDKLSFDFRKSFPDAAFPMSDESGEPYCYTYEVSADPDGTSIAGYSQSTEYKRTSEHLVGNITLSHSPETITLSGEKKWVAPTSVQLPNSVEFKVKTSETSWLVPSATAANSWKYEAMGLRKYKDGKEAEYLVSESSYIPGFVSEMTGYDAVNTYFPYAKLSLVHEIGNEGSISDAARAKAHASFYAFVEKDGNPASLTLLGKVGDEAVEVSNGSVVDVAPGQSLVFDSVPSDIEVRFVRADLSDGWKDSGDDEKEVELRAGADESVTFTSTYSSMGRKLLDIRKELSGRALENGQFTFEMVNSAGNVIATGRNDAEGKVFLPSVNATEKDDGKDITVRVRERRDDTMNGYTWDESMWVATLHAADDGTGNMVLSESVAKDGTMGSSVSPETPITFRNSYTARGDLYLSAWTTLSGMELQDQQFEFQLADAETGESVMTAKNDAEGNVTFGPISLDQTYVGRELHYVATEVAGDDERVTYDDARFSYTVKISDKGDGTLGFETTTDANPVFRNLAKPGTLTVTKQVNGSGEGIDDSEHMFRVTMAGNNYYSSPYAAIYGDMLVIGRGVPEQEIDGEELIESWDLEQLEVNPLVDIGDTGIIQSDERPWAGYAEDIVHIVVRDGIAPVSSAGWFQGLVNAVDANILGFSSVSLADARAMFSGCSALKTIYVADDADWSGIERSEEMFAGDMQLCGYKGTTYSVFATDASRAIVDSLNGKKGYFTRLVTVHYDENGGQALLDSDRKISRTGESMISEQVPKRLGYDFAGWYYDEEMKLPVNEEDSFAEHGNTEDSITLYAGWNPKMMNFKFVRDLIWGQEESESFEHGDQPGQIDDEYNVLIVDVVSVPWNEVSFSAPNEKAPEGYTFSASWEYLYFFDLFTDGMDAQQCWSLASWYYADLYGISYDGTEYTLPDYNGETIFVYLEPTEQQCHVNLDTNGYGTTFSDPTTSYGYNEVISSHWGLASQGQEFDGWWTKPEGGIQILDADGNNPLNLTMKDLYEVLVSEGTIPSADYDEPVIFYIHWHWHETNIHFDVNGGIGSFPDVVMGWQDSFDTSDKVPIRDGYIFRGWYIDAECTNANRIPDVADSYDFLRLGTSIDYKTQITIYAGWRVVSEGYVYEGDLGADGASVHWGIDVNGTLVISPTDGTYGELPSNSYNYDNYFPWYAYRDEIVGIRVEQGVSTVQDANLYNIFGGLGYLRSIDAENLDVSKAKSLNRAFASDSRLVEANISSWDTSNVTSMKEMFYYNQTMQKLDIGNWRVDSVEVFSSMFYSCSKLSELNLRQWNVRSAQYVDYMFAYCRVLADFSFLNTWIVDNVIDFHNMFSACTKMTNLDLCQWNTKNATNMSNMFSGCSSLEIFEQSFYTSQVTDMSGMFNGCIALTDVHVQNFDMRNVTKINTMFLNCKKLAELDVENWNTQSLSEMKSAFRSCESLISLDLSSWNTQNLTALCDEGASAYGGYGAFEGCTSLISLNLANWNVRGASTFCNLFYNCTSLAELNIDNWEPENLISIKSMFYKCSSLTTLDLSAWNVDNVTTASRVDNQNRYSYGTFGECTSLTDLNLSTWRLPNLTNASHMFNGCSSLTNLNIESLELGSCTAAESTFYGCTKLKKLDLSSWDTSNLSDASNIFGYSWQQESELAEINLSGWTCEKMTEGLSIPRSVTKITLSDKCLISSFPYLDSSGASPYTGNWVSQDAPNKGPLTRDQIVSISKESPALLAGTWIPEERPVEYIVDFEAGTLPGTGVVTPTGSMESQHIALSSEQTASYTFPLLDDCTFYAYGYKPVGWKNVATGTTYHLGECMLKGLTNQAGTTITIAPVWAKDESTSPAQKGNTIAFTLKPGETSVLDNLAPGTSYMVEELSQSGWELLRTEGNASGTIAANDVSQVTFVNQKKILMPGVTEEMKFTIAGTKTLDEKPAGGYFFELLLYGTRIATATSDEHGAFSFDLVAEYDELENGGLDYVVREIPGDDASVEYDAHEATVHAYAEDGYVKLSGTETLAFENHSKPATLSLSQTVPAGANENVSFVYSVKTGPDQADVSEVTLIPGEAPVEVAVTPGYAVRVYPENVPAGFTSQATDTGLMVSPEAGIAAGGHHDAVISSTYKMTGKSVIPVIVTLEHATMTGGDFSFAMSEKAESAISTAAEDKGLYSTVNSESGHAAFMVSYSGSELDLTKNAVTYVVSQDPEPVLSQWAGKVVMDSSSHEVKVGWNDNGDGTASPVLECSDDACAQSGSVLFSNAVKTVDLLFTKETIGATDVASSSRFRYVLDIVQPSQLQPEGSISAASLPGEPERYAMMGEDGSESEFSNGGEIEFSSASGAGVTIRNVPVGSGYRISAVDVPDGFDNTGSNRANGTVPLSASGKVEVPLTSAYASTGKLRLDTLSIAYGFTQHKGQFSFSARQILDGIVQPAQVKVQNGEDGLVTFPLGTLSSKDDGKTLTYILSQDKVTDKMYGTDPLNAKVTLTIGDDGAGNMSAAVSSVEYLAVQGEVDEESVEEHAKLVDEQGKPVFITTYGMTLPTTGEVPWVMVVLYLLAVALIARSTTSIWARDGRCEGGHETDSSSQANGAAK